MFPNVGCCDRAENGQQGAKVNVRRPEEATAIVLTRDHGGWLRKESMELEKSEKVQQINRISRPNVIDKEVLRITLCSP